MAPFQHLVEEANIAWAFTYRDFTGKIIKILPVGVSEDRAQLNIFFYNSYGRSILILHHRLLPLSQLTLHHPPPQHQQMHTPKLSPPLHLCHKQPNQRHRRRSNQQTRSSHRLRTRQSPGGLRKIWGLHRRVLITCLCHGGRGRSYNFYGTRRST